MGDPNLFYTYSNFALTAVSVGTNMHIMRGSAGSAGSAGVYISIPGAARNTKVNAIIMFPEELSDPVFFLSADRLRVSPRLLFHYLNQYEGG